VTNPSSDQEYCPVRTTELKDWTENQSHDSGSCHYCAKVTLLRTEPFGQRLACKPCWENICYGAEDE
jgi:hypothetical protein